MNHPLLPRRSLPQLILVGAALISWCLPTEAEQKPLSQEKFAGELSAGWTWIDEQPSPWRLVDESLDLKSMPIAIRRLFRQDFS